MSGQVGSLSMEHDMIVSGLDPLWLCITEVEAEHGSADVC